MIVTLTNTSGGTLNALDVHEGGSGAVGGARKDPLPHPFDWITSLAAAGTMVYAVHPSDFRFKSVLWKPLDANTMLNQMVNAGQITLAQGAEAGRTDSEELFINDI